MGDAGSRMGRRTLALVMPVERPMLRGWLHAGAFVAALPAGAMLIAAAEHAAARTAASIYVCGLLLLFGTSASYHCLARGERARWIMRRLDHSMIFVLIAATYTPVCLLGLPASWGIPVLAVIWTGAVTGVVLKLAAFDRMRWLGSALYPVLGWTAVVATPALVSHLTTAQFVLVAVGGLAYSIGMPVLLTQRPNPWPTTFGYHEVWHAFTIVAAGCHFAAIALLVR